MQENITNGFSSLSYDDLKINDSFKDINGCLVGMDISNELPNDSNTCNPEKENFLTKFKKSKRPQGKHRSKLIGHVCFNVLNIDPLELEYKSKIYNEREAIQFKNRNLI